jgi:hypothetical protein
MDWQALWDDTERLYDKFREAKVAPNTPEDRRVNDAINDMLDLLEQVEGLLEAEGAKIQELECHRS